MGTIYSEDSDFSICKEEDESRGVLRNVYRTTRREVPKTVTLKPVFIVLPTCIFNVCTEFLIGSSGERRILFRSCICFRLSRRSGGYVLFFHCRASGYILDDIIWDSEWHWSRFFSELKFFPAKHNFTIAPYPSVTEDMRLPLPGLGWFRCKDVRYIFRFPVFWYCWSQHALWSRILIR
jgi:hypothetical protein